MKERQSDSCMLERVIAGLMLWSDSTHLAQISHVSVTFGLVEVEHRPSENRGLLLVDSGHRFKMSLNEGRSSQASRVKD